tara:strand:+ start:153 stop:296 length:144 start_codon:yes stop_codon:yes gene_type:complete
MEKLTNKQEIKKLLSDNLRLQAIIFEQMEQLNIATELFKEILDSYED